LEAVTWGVLTGLRLEPVPQENVRAACKLKTRPDQEDLVAPVAWSLAEAYTMPGIAWPDCGHGGWTPLRCAVAGAANPLITRLLLEAGDGADPGRS
jgi:hypothetical protein